MTNDKDKYIKHLFTQSSPLVDKFMQDNLIRDRKEETGFKLEFT